MSTPSVLQQALAQCIAKRLTFAAFRRPGRPLQLWAQRTPELETVEGTLLLGLNQVFLVAPFELDPARVPFIRADVELRFAEIDPEDIENHSNRSPFPTLHLLREDSIDRAVEAYPDPDAIVERNYATLRQLGHAGWQRLFED